MSKSRSRSITTTKNYRLFKISEDNRNLDLKKHKKLRESMAKYGFLQSFPVVCFRDENKSLVVKDGQHRLALAEELGLPVHYVIEDVDFDIAVINCTPKTWSLRDYAQTYASKGVEAYIEGIEFADSHGIPIGTAFGLLAGTTSFNNVQGAFIDGDFEIRDRDWANSVASLYTSMIGLSKELRKSQFLIACMAVCRVETFDAARLLGGAKRCRDKLVSYSTRDAYLEMLQEVYNFGRKSLEPLKIQAVQAMRDRAAIKKKD